jgi:hypothetical protein
MKKTIVFFAQSTKTWVGAWWLAVALAGFAQAEPSATNKPAAPVLTRTFPLEGVRGTRPQVGVPGRIDHLAYDPATKRLFVAALENGSVEVIDLKVGRRIRSLGGLAHPQGAAVVPELDAVAVACGGDGKLRVFDTHSLAETQVVEIGPDADNVRYDAKNGTVLVSYGSTNSGAIAVLIPGNWSIAREIPFKSRPESFQLDPASDRLFANLPKGVRAVEDGAVAWANRQTGAPEGLIPLKGRARNFPMAYDAARQRLFVACRRPARLIAIDAQTQEILSEAVCTDDSDDLFYDAQTESVLVIGGGFRPDLQDTPSPVSPAGEMGAIDVFKVSKKGQLARVSTTPTAPHARTGLFVPARRMLYLAVSMRGGKDPEIREYHWAP